MAINCPFRRKNIGFLQICQLKIIILRPPFNNKISNYIKPWTQKPVKQNAKMDYLDVFSSEYSNHLGYLLNTLIIHKDKNCRRMRPFYHCHWQDNQPRTRRWREAMELCMRKHTKNIKTSSSAQGWEVIADFYAQSRWFLAYKDDPQVKKKGLISPQFSRRVICIPSSGSQK